MPNDNVTPLKAKSILDQAKEEVAAEIAAKAKDRIKAKLRERANAETILNNIDREIKDLEQAIADGNV